MDELDNRPDGAGDDDLDQEIIEDGESSGKYDRLLNDSSRKYKLSGMFREWFLDYSSYVILQRAVPHIDDGLKPVQRRVLHTMYKVDDGTYTVPLYSSWVKEDEVNHTFDAGQRIKLKNPAYFGTSGRTSRVIGWEMCLDIPYDRPVYTIGESAQYSRLGELEDKVDALTLNGQAFRRKLENFLSKEAFCR